MPIYQNLAVGGGVGFIGTDPTPRLDVTGIDKYYDALLKARMYVKQQEELGKPDLSKYYEKLQGLEATQANTEILAHRLSDISTKLQGTVSKFGGSDWNLAHRTPEFQSAMNEFGPWMSEMNAAKMNLKTAEAYGTTIKDSGKVGTWALDADGNPIDFLNRPGNIYIDTPMTKSSYYKYKSTVPSASTVTTEDWENNHGTLKDTSELVNQVTSGIGANDWISGAQLGKATDPAGGYIATLVNQSGSNNIQQVNAARKAFELAYKGTAAYNGINQAYADHVIEMRQQKKAPLTKDSFVDDVVGKLFESKYNRELKRTESHIPAGTGGAANDLKTDWFKETALGNPNTVDWSNPVAKTQMEPVIKDGNLTGYEARGTVLYPGTIPPTEMQDKILVPGTEVSKVTSMMSIGGLEGPVMDPKGKNIYIMGDGISAAYGTYAVRQKRTEKWTLANKEYDKAIKDAQAKGIEPNFEFKPMVAYEVNTLWDPRTAQDQKLPSEFGNVNGKATVDDMYPNGFLTKNVNPKYKDFVSEIPKDAPAIKEMEKKNLSMSGGLPEGFWRNSDAVKVRAFIYVDPNSLIYNDPFGARSSYGGQTMGILKGEMKNVQKAPVSGDLYKKALIPQ